MSKLRQLSFRSEDEAIAEIDRLRASGYRQRGNWSLPMICRHLMGPSGNGLQPPASPTPTPEQAAKKKGFIDLILSTGKPPPNFEAPPEMTPPSTCDDRDIERYRAALADLKAYPHRLVDFGPFGPVPIEEVRQLTLQHTAHHLSFLEPAPPSRREGLHFDNEDQVIADVQAVRRGYRQAGAWSLPMMCAHLEKAVRTRMQPGPFPANTPEQDSRKPMLDQILSSGKLPRIEAPPAMQPPADVAEAAIDALIAALTEFKSFKGQIAPHRIFGLLPDTDARRLNLIHCAHHLSYLTPTETGLTQ